MKNKTVVGVVFALVIVAGVAAAYMLTRPSAGTNSLNGKRIEVAFLAYGIRPETAAEIKMDTLIYDETGKECFTITGITAVPAEIDAYDSNGGLHVVGHPILKDVVITARSLGPKIAWAYMYARDKILAGANVAIYGDTWKVWTRILTVHDLP